MPHVARAQSRNFSFAYDQPRTTGYGILADIFGNKLKELSKGTMSIDQFPGAQLGQEPQALQKVRSGDIDFNISSTANASTVAPESGVFSLHFLFTGEAHLAKAIADPGVVAAVRAMFKERVQGAQVLAVGTLGLRNIYAKREIRNVGDMKGLKIRVQATKTE
ncbi:MAG: TRAP transporter substrate-binding protein DctP, partial [Alphaproteobacteria bacterium]|nr:TRAP transporter substrate-binding protein DctP [Alphaproteobacteria bacterium]